MAPISKKSKSVKSKKDIKVVESIMKEEEAVVEQFSDSDPDLQELVNELDSDQDTGVQDEPEIKEDDFASAQSEIKLMMEKAQVKKRSAPSSDRAPDSEETPAVVYVGRIPHGFYEDQLKNYFSQFGQVVRLRLSRNKKTGKSKHYAFIEFENREVADIVVECMDNYLLFGHILKCKIVPQDRVHENLWKGANRKFRVVPWQSIHRERHNKLKTKEQYEKNVTRLIEKEQKLKEKLSTLGIDYTFSGYAEQKKLQDAPPEPPKPAPKEAAKRKRTAAKPSTKSKADVGKPKPVTGRATRKVKTV